MFPNCIFPQNLYFIYLVPTRINTIFMRAAQKIMTHIFFLAYIYS